MVPLTKCPGCQGPFFRINYNSNWHEERCEKRCKLDYSQYHKLNFDDNDIGYFTFNTQDFNVYAYVESFSYKNIIHIYYHNPPRVGAQPPALRIPLFEIEWDNLDYYNNKWRIWTVFS